MKQNYLSHDNLLKMAKNDINSLTRSLKAFHENAKEEKDAMDRKINQQEQSNKASLKEMQMQFFSKMSERDMKISELESQVIKII